MCVIIYPPATHPSFTSKNFQNFQVLHQKKLSAFVWCVLLFTLLPLSQVYTHSTHGGEGGGRVSLCILNALFAQIFISILQDFCIKMLILHFIWKQRFLRLAVHWWPVRFPDPLGSVREPDLLDDLCIDHWLFVLIISASQRGPCLTGDNLVKRRNWCRAGSKF